MSHHLWNHLKLSYVVAVGIGVVVVVALAVVFDDTAVVADVDMVVDVAGISVVDLAVAEDEDDYAAVVAVGDNYAGACVAVAPSRCA